MDIEHRMNMLAYAMEGVAASLGLKLSSPRAEAHRKYLARRRRKRQMRRYTS